MAEVTHAIMRAVVEATMSLSASDQVRGAETPVAFASDGGIEGAGPVPPKRCQIEFQASLIDSHVGCGVGDGVDSMGRKRVRSGHLAERV